MRLTVFILALCTSILPLILAQNSDREITASYEQTGMCAYFFENPTKWSSLRETCVKYCQNNRGHGYSECDHNSYNNADFESNPIKSQVQTDDDGDRWIPCPCKCRNKDVEGIEEKIIDVVAEGLSQLDDIICAAMLEAFKTIIEVGIDMVPGGAQLNGAKIAVEGAKSFAENALEAADFFDDWVAKACGRPDWNFDLWGSLIGAPDKYGTSIGCKRRQRYKCEKVEPKPEPTKNPDKPSVSSKTEDPATTSKKEEPNPTSTKSSSSSDSCGSGTNTKSASTCEKTTPCEIRHPDDGSDTAQKRNGRDSPRPVLWEKRQSGPKEGSPCSANEDYKDWILSSGNYPSNGQLDENVAAYGWETQNSYCDYKWQSGTKRNPNSRYDSEHVMEWQIVTDFFAKMNAKGGTEYKHPNPTKGKELVDFCTYWIESWSLEDNQAFAIDGGPELTPWEHIATAYPSNQNYKEEMIALQRTINTPTKANLFSDHIPMIWTEDTMNKLIDSNRNKVLERLRLALGAQMYLTEKDVKGIFEKQKTRMGTVLDDLDKNMASHAREYKAKGRLKTYYAWEEQDLLTEWNSYMDAKWETATKKHKKVMDTWTKKLDDVYCKNKDDQSEKNDDQSQKKDDRSKDDKVFCDRLKSLQEQYEAAPAFSRPW